MELSVIIPASGNGELLVKCLKSLDQTVCFDYEVCVVDDGGALDEETVREQANAPYRLVWCSFPLPRGRAAARNEGVLSTTGAVIVFLDSDMEARAGFLSAHYESHRSRPKTAVIGRIEWPVKGGFYRYIGTRGVMKLKPGEPVPPKYLVTGNASIERKDLYSDAPFDTSLKGWGGEDLDLGLKLNAYGVSFAYEPAAVSFHHFGGTLKEHMERTFQYGKNTLPALVERHPEIRVMTSLNVLESWVWRFLVKQWVVFPVIATAEALDALPLPQALYDYLTFAAYARGWLEGKKP